MNRPPFRRTAAALLLGAALAAAQLPGNVTLTPVFGTEAANKMARPVWMGEIPGQKSHFLVLEQGYSTGTGTVYHFEPSAGGAYARKEFLTLPVRRSANEMGLLGFAFHPKFSENRKYYLYYILPAGGGDTAVIVERRADATFKKDAGEDSRRVFTQAKGAINHNGGTLAFGKDGYLYLGIGDDAIGANGQSRAKTLGAILRLDVDNPSDGLGYGIPSDNPFVNESGVRKEIWVYGLRNPWKWSFDPLTGDLWIGDVGETSQEEIDVAKKGDNMGWAVLEGGACITAGCSLAGKVPPIKTFRRDSAQSIIGGMVYRGNPSSPFYGAFFFSDYFTKHVWAVTQKDGQMTALARVAGAASFPVSFARDSDDNLYLLGFEPGTIYRLGHETFSASPVKSRRRRTGSLRPYQIRPGALVMTAASGPSGPLLVQDFAGKVVADYRNGSLPLGGVIHLAPGCYRLVFGAGASTTSETVAIP